MSDMSSIDIQLPDSSERLLYINGPIDENQYAQFVEKLNIIDMKDVDMIRSNIQKLAMLGVDVDTFNMPPIKVFMNSPGGYIYDALSIYDMLSKRKDIGVIVTGKCMSAATFILLAFPPDMRLATENTTFMIHQPSSWAIGKLKDQEEDVAETKRLHKLINSIYLKNTNITKEKLKEIYETKKDYYFTAKEALKLGFISKKV